MDRTESVKPKPSWIVSVLDQLSEGLLVALALGCAGLVLTAGITFLSQAYQYLKTGAWPDWVLFTAISKYLPAEFLTWLFNPQDWYGVHKIAVFVFLQCPIEAILIVAAFAWGVVVAMMMKAVESMTEAYK